MLSIVDYCLNVQAKLSKLAPETVKGKREWFGDTGRASVAVSHAMDGKDGKALRISEKLADKYQIT